METPHHPINPTNWAGNITYGTTSVHYPTTVAEVQEVVRRCHQVKALGSRHSFNRIADSTQHQVSLHYMNQVVSLDKAAQTVTVEGGMRYGELAPYLHAHGFALPNLASLPHIAIAGACATATHGSGVHNGNLATTVSGMELVTAAGDVVTLSRDKDGETFRGAVVHLGALGIVTKVTLDLQPTYAVRQVVYRNLPMEVLKQNFFEIMSCGYSVSLFTTWQNKTINQVWVKSREGGRAEESNPLLYGATLATQPLHPLEELSAEHATEQLGLAGSWYERLPHFKMGFQPSAGKELQSEYFVPMEQAYEALGALEKLQELLTPYLFVSEIRAIAADDLWLSPCYRKACIAFHFTWKQEWDVVQRLLPQIEAALAPYQPLPHWGKIFTMAPAVIQSRCSKLADFKELAQAYDPEGKFRNAFLAQLLEEA